MDSLKKKKPERSARKPPENLTELRSEHSIGKPVMARISSMRAVLQGFKVLLDEDLQPLGITASPLRMLWSIAENPGISGAKVARLCSVTPQSGQATLAMMEAQGWVRRRPSEANHRVLVAELTSKGQRVLVKAQKIAGTLDRRLWNGIGNRDLAGLDAALRSALEKLTRKTGFE
jgi:DNA-binding MarR family transcriptional regulator